MARELRDPTYEEWRTWVFDHPVTRPEWHFDVEADHWVEENDPGHRTVEFLTRLFEEPGALTSLFTDGQIAQGLNFLVSPACSNHMFALVNEAVPWKQRERGIRAMGILFRDLFARVCPDRLSHLDYSPGDESPLNTVCYMWWDNCPLPFSAVVSEKLQVTAAVFDVLRETLRLPSLACREAALHGLGHLYGEHPSEVERIVDHFLAREPRMPRELRHYALAARTGCVQ
jgi:hypothetical protein